MRLPTWLQRFLPRKRTAGHPYSIKGWVRDVDGIYRMYDCADQIWQSGSVWKRGVSWANVEYPTLRAAIAQETDAGTSTRFSGANSVTVPEGRKEHGHLA